VGSENNVHSFLISTLDTGNCSSNFKAEIGPIASRIEGKVTKLNEQINIHIYRHNRLRRRSPLLECFTYNFIRPLSLPSPVNRAPSHQQLSTSNAHNRGWSNSVQSMLDWTHRLPNSGTIILFMWTDRSDSPLFALPSRKDTKAVMTALVRDYLCVVV